MPHPYAKRVVFEGEIKPDECDAVFTIEGWEEERQDGLVGVTLRCNGHYLTTHRARNWNRLFKRKEWT